MLIVNLIFLNNFETHHAEESEEDMLFKGGAGIDRFHFDPLSPDGTKSSEDGLWQLGDRRRFDEEDVGKTVLQKLVIVVVAGWWWWRETRNADTCSTAEKTSTDPGIHLRE